MKLNKNKLLTAVILVLIGVIVFQNIIFQINYSKYNNDIELLDNRNDLLMKDLKSNEIQINKLNDKINISESKNLKYKNELDSLYILSKYNKNKYNEKINNINSISNRELIRQFTETFNTR